MKTNKILLIAIIGFFTSCSSGNDNENPDVPNPQSGSVIIEVPEGCEDYFSKEMNFDSPASQKELIFSCNVPWTISVADNRDGNAWCSVTPTNGIAGTSTVIVKVLENTTYDDRNAVITLTAGGETRTVFVNQKQREALVLTSDRFEVPVTGGTVNIEVKSNIDYEVAVSDECKSWIHQSSTRSLTSSIISFTVDKSEEYDKREGKIIIRGNGKEEVATIYQAGEGILVLSSNTYNISSAKQELVIDISSNFDYSVDLGNYDWMTEITQNTRGISTHTLRLAVSENTEYSDRVARIKVYDKKSSLSEEIEIIQAPKEALFINKNEFEFDEKGGTFVVEVQSNSNYEVNIGCDWIEEVSTRALSDHSHTFKVAAITNNKDRQATITFKMVSSGISENVIVKQICGLFLDTESLSLMTGDVRKLNLTNKTNQNVKWSSSNSSVATVDNTGTVTAIGRGNATITVKTDDGKHTCTCDVSVKEITDFISVSNTGGAISAINGLIRYGSVLSWRFSNNSQVSVTLKSLQLIDGETGEAGNIMTVDNVVEAGNSVAYSTTIGLLGIHAPVTCRFRYDYNGNEYFADAIYNIPTW